MQVLPESTVFFPGTSKIGLCPIPIFHKHFFQASDKSIAEKITLVEAWSLLRSKLIQNKKISINLKKAKFNKIFVYIAFKKFVKLNDFHSPIRIHHKTQYQGFYRDRLVTTSKVNKFFDLPEYSMKVVTTLGDDVTVEVSYLEDIGLM